MDVRRYRAQSLVAERNSSIRRHHARALHWLHHARADDVLDELVAAVAVQPFAVAKARAESGDSARVRSMAGGADGTTLPSEHRFALRDQLWGDDRVGC